MPNILIVEDNEVTIRTVDRLISRAGFTVFAAPNGIEAMKILEQQSFDLVVTDLDMPFVSGQDLVQFIRARWAQMPIIVVSSRGEEKSKLACYELGIDDFLTKPISPAELVAKIKKMVGGQHG